jgi:hypothetical protein
MALANPDAWKAARAQKLSENQAHRNAKRNRAAQATKTAATDAVEHVLSFDEKRVSDIVKSFLDTALAERGEASVDNTASDTRFWGRFMRDRYPKLGLAAFAAAEAQRWYEVRHPRPARPPRRDDFGGGVKGSRK